MKKSLLFLVALGLSMFGTSLTLNAAPQKDTKENPAVPSPFAASPEGSEEKPAVKSQKMYDVNRKLYNVTFNEHGAIFKSEWAKEEFYLGIDCDTTSEKHGKGRWRYSDLGIIIEFPKKRFLFRREKLNIQNKGKCKM